MGFAPITTFSTPNQKLNDKLSVYGRIGKCLFEKKILRGKN